VNGRAGTQEVDSDKLDKLELQRKKREERDKTSELIELGYQLKQSRVESITVGGVSLSIDEWKKIKDTFSDPAKLALVREQMRTEGKSDAYINESEYLSRIAADIAIKKHSGEELTAEERSVEARLDNDPAAVEKVEHFAETRKAVVDRRLEGDRSVSEETNALTASIDDEVQFRVVANETVSEIEVERAELARSGISAYQWAKT